MTISIIRAILQIFSWNFSAISWQNQTAKYKIFKTILIAAGKI